MANFTMFTREKKEEFLRLYPKLRNVGKVAQKLGLSRRALYQAREADKDFDEKWAEITQGIAEDLEAEAYRRAHDGCRKPVFYKGKKVGTIKEYSDTVLIFLLKAYNPQKFRELYKHEITGPDGMPIPFKCVLGVDDGKL